MAKGFEGSRPDVGGRESPITKEDYLRYDLTTGVPIQGAASKSYFDLTIDNQFWDADAEVTRVGAFFQAIQSRIYAAAEVATTSIRRQWYLGQAESLERFADILGIRVRDLTYEAYRSRMRDAYLAYQDGGAISSIMRIVGSYTGCPVFITKVPSFPGYWILNSSFITPVRTPKPDIPFTFADNDVQVIGLSSNTVPGRGILEVTTQNGYPVGGRWTMVPVASGGMTGPEVKFPQTGRYVLPAGGPDPREDRIDDNPSEISIEIQRPFSLVPGASAVQTANIDVLPTPDTCQFGQNWLPSSFNVSHGLVVEALGMGKLSASAREEMLEKLHDVADLPPLNLIENQHEQPSRILVGEKIAGDFWPDLSLTPGASGVDMGEGTTRLNGTDFSLTIAGELQQSVPQSCGPYLVIKERFNEYENAIPDNFELGPAHTWVVRDEIVGQPLMISGVSIIQLGGGLPTGLGRMFYHAPTQTIQFQAPDPDGDDGFDPEGIDAALDWSPSSVGLSGVSLHAVSCPTPPGTGTLRYTAAAGPEPAKFTWEAPEGAEGAPVNVQADGRYVIASGGPPPVVGGGPATLTIDVTLASLPLVDTTDSVAISISSSIASGGEVSVLSGNNAYQIRLRVSPLILPADSTFSFVRFRSAELQTVPLDLSPLAIKDPTLIDVSLLDRTYSQNVNRGFYYRLGSDPDLSDPSWGEWLPLDVLDRFEATDQYVQFRIEILDDPDYFGFPLKKDYEFIGIALRPSFTVWTEECYRHFDDFHRITTGGLDVIAPGEPGNDDLFRDTGLVTMGYDGALSTTVSPCAIDTLEEHLTIPDQQTMPHFDIPRRISTLVPEPTGGAPPAPVLIRPTATLVTSASGGFAEIEIDFDSSGSFDPDGSVERWQYDFGDGEITPWLPAAGFVSHLYRDPGVFAARVRVRDNDFLVSDWVEESVVVLAPTATGGGSIPIANVTASALEIIEGNTITFDMSTSVDYDGTIIGYRYKSGDGDDTGFIVDDAHSFLYSTQGLYTAEFRVLDNDGNFSAWTPLDITITPAASGSDPTNEPPIADLETLVEAPTGFVVEFDMSGSTDVDGTVEAYQMDFGDGDVTTFVAGSVFTHVYAATGTYTARGRVRDDDGAVSDWVEEIIQLPEASFPVPVLVVIPS